MAGGGIGGIDDTETFLSRVEILDTTESLQWYQAASLPHPCYQMSSATIGNMCYLLSGYIKGGASKSVCLDNLISQAVSQPANASAPPTPSPWQSLPDIPLTYSTALAFNGALLAVGGGLSGSSAIHVYQPSSNSWVKAGELSTERYNSNCVVLPSGEMLVAGGGGDATNKKGRNSVNSVKDAMVIAVTFILLIQMFLPLAVNKASTFFLNGKIPQKCHSMSITVFPYTCMPNAFNY